MKHILKLRFIGTGFSGYQVQPEKRTVQSTLQDAIEMLFGTRYDVKGCSRTDSGVHANVFYATFDLPDGTSSITADKMPAAFNSVLPDDVAVTAATTVDDDFHVRHNVTYKEYIYVINNSSHRDPFSVGRSHHFPRMIDLSGIDKMNVAAQYICGKHDFACFMSSGSSVEDTVRDVKYLEVTKSDDIITIRIAADGFLYNMVRIIAGTLLDVGRGKTSPDTVKEMLRSLDRTKSGPTLPACGLYLNHVEFDGKIF